MKKLFVFTVILLLSFSIASAITANSIELADLGFTGFVVEANLDTSGTARVFYGKTGALGSTSRAYSSSAPTSSEHLLQVDGLESGTVYFFRVVGSDTQGNTYTSAIGLTRTATSSSTTPPPKPVPTPVPPSIPPPTNTVPSTEIGSPGVTFDASCYDPAYPDMKQWQKAGVVGGIPKNLKVVQTISPGTNNIQSAIDSVANKGGGVLLLTRGTYRITKTLQMKSKVVLRGVERDDVIIESTIRSPGPRAKLGRGSVVFGNGVHYAGLEDLTIFYRVDNCEPRDDLTLSSPRWVEVYAPDPCGITDLHSSGVEFFLEAENNWLDGVAILESGTNPIRIWADHTTIRNSKVDRTYNKGVGGYLYYSGDYNLFVNNEAGRIRHLILASFGGWYPAKYNVIYNNNLAVDVNFHDGDGGHNLIENNDIKIPIYAHGNGQALWSGHPKYGHLPPGDGNVIYNNRILDNNKVNNAWRNVNAIYTLTGYDNIYATGWKTPKCQTFYPVNAK